MKAGVVGMVPATAPKAAVVSSEAVDRATCMYETEWQTTDVISALSSQSTPGRAEKRVLIPHKRGLVANDFMWTDDTKPQQFSLVSVILLPNTDELCCQNDDATEVPVKDVYLAHLAINTRMRSIHILLS